MGACLPASLAVRAMIQNKGSFGLAGRAQIQNKLAGIRENEGISENKHKWGFRAQPQPKSECQVQGPFSLAVRSKIHDNLASNGVNTGSWPSSHACRRA